MWTVCNRTPYGAARNWVRNKHGVHQWIVAIKATFSIGSSGKLTLADEQLPPALAPVYFAKPGASSLRFDSDLLAAKPCTDIVANASAYAPRGRKASSVEVSMRVGDLYKTLRVFGDRTYERSLTGAVEPSAPRPFDVQPIRYELAVGGTDTHSSDARKHKYDAMNPVGRGLAANPSQLVGAPAPVIEVGTSAQKYNGPAGFGPIDGAWSPRRELAGTYDAAWEQRKKPLLPDDYNEFYASCAPRDQRSTSFARGGEIFELQNMTAAGCLRFELPRIQLMCTTHVGAKCHKHPANMTLVLLEPDLASCYMVWQSVLAVPAKQTEYLDMTVVEEARGSA